MSFFRDLKIAVRSLARARALWITVALTLALGIGANSAIFSIVRAVLLRPLNNRDEDRLLYVRQSASGLGQTETNWSIPEIDDISKNLKSISEIGTFSQVAFTVVGLGTPREIPAGVVDGHYFETVGLHPVLGRLIGPQDDGQNAAGAVVLTYKFWTGALHSDPGVLGKQLRLESFAGARTGTVVGVLEPSVPYPVETEIIANLVTSPHHLSATMVTGREHRMTEVFARLAPGATLEQARAELQAVHTGMLKAHPEVYRPEHNYQITATRLHDQINSRANTVLWVLFAAAALLFIIACSNVANLVFARTVRREGELAMRTALGASRGQLRRALLAESVVLCFSGVIAAMLVAAPMVSILGRYAARFSVRADGLKLDMSFVWFGIALAIAASIFLAFIPRLPAAQVSRSLSAAGVGTRVTGANGRRLRIFAVTQIAASFLLLAGAGVLMRTLYELESTRPPYNSANVLAVNLPPIAYGRTPEQIQNFDRDVKARVAALPGVESVASGFSTPWRDAQGLSIAFQFAVEGVAKKNGVDDPRAKFRSISPNFFNTLGMPIIEGRDFRDTDKAGAERVVIISQSLAKNLFPGQEAIGREIRWTDSVMKFIGISYEPRRIVGVVPDVDDENIIPAPAMTIYQPVAQEWVAARLFVRAKGDPYSLVPAITRSIHEMDGNQPVERAATLNDIRAEVLTPDRLNAIVFGGFAAIALLISVVGVAGVLAFSVSGRTREFGIRIAMGAQPRDILGGVLREGVIMAGIGVAAGVVVGFAAMKAVLRFVSQLHMPSILTLLAAALVIVAAAVIASAIPAMRAARVNAVEALRSE
ncbi:ABC efflux pump, inner membrane subunit [Candidatus Koribacter versatilis Ellin345]|uniref:ABC efflux pump, inner membrane subunit n=1 Tax=Koribacter versatilis (strain Ellin345) TaxID=204669 RepID=Q1IKK8_KORVE|nr:ADOP family duplicated permease [Candidatus Koribacter versatilis]ABF42592.1 ABC efflux pump, inner membrane subunit [Candidatus Koribacter versatilis Ellin345]